MFLCPMSHVRWFDDLNVDYPSAVLPWHHKQICIY